MVLLPSHQFAFPLIGLTKHLFLSSWQLDRVPLRRKISSTQVMLLSGQEKKIRTQEEGNVVFLAGYQCKRNWAFIVNPDSTCNNNPGTLLLCSYSSAFWSLGSRKWLNSCCGFIGVVSCFPLIPTKFGPATKWKQNIWSESQKRKRLFALYRFCVLSNLIRWHCMLRLEIQKNTEKYWKILTNTEKY